MKPKIGDRYISPGNIKYTFCEDGKWRDQYGVWWSQAVNETIMNYCRLEEKEYNFTSLYNKLSTK